MKTKLFFFVSFFLIFSVPVIAQTGSGMTPESTSDNGKSAKWDTLSHQGRSGDFLVGKVTIVEGSLPWYPVPVTVTCDGKISYTTNADPKGGFEISAIETSPTKVGVEGATSKPASKFVGCTVEAALPGFTSSILTIASRNILDDTDIGTVKLSREQGSGGAAVSSTTDSAPREATKAFEQARREWLEQKPDQAQRDLQKAVHLYPQFAEAWYQLGKIQETASPQDAAISFSKSAAADPKFILPYEHLVVFAAQASKWQEVADDTAHELELNPRGNPQVWYYNALGNYKLNKKEVAETSAVKALSMDPLHTQPNTEQLIAVILADKHDFAGALAHLRNCLTYLPSGPSADVVKQQVAQLEKMVPAAN